MTMNMPKNIIFSVFLYFLYVSKSSGIISRRNYSCRGLYAAHRLDTAQFTATDNQ